MDRVGDAVALASDNEASLEAIYQGVVDVLERLGVDRRFKFSLVLDAEAHGQQFIVGDVVPARIIIAAKGVQANLDAEAALTAAAIEKAKRGAANG